MAGAPALMTEGDVVVWANAAVRDGLAEGMATSAPVCSKCSKCSKMAPHETIVLY